MDPFVDQLARLSVEHPTRAKWVLVPTHAIGRTLGERIALEGTNWLNLRFVTPLDIALQMGAPFLVECGVDPSGRTGFVRANFRPTREIGEQRKDISRRVNWIRMPSRPNTFIADLYPAARVTSSAEETTSLLSSFSEMLRASSRFPFGSAPCSRRTKRWA